MAFSKGEMAQVRANLNPGSMPPMLQLKGAITKIFECVESHAGPGEQTHMYMLRYDDTNEFYIVSDRLTGSIFLDGFFVPDTADFDRLMTVRNKIEKRCVMPASKEGMELWQRYACSRRTLSFVGVYLRLQVQVWLHHVLCLRLWFGEKTQSICPAASRVSLNLAFASLSLSSLPSHTSSLWSTTSWLLRYLLTRPRVDKRKRRKHLALHRQLWQRQGRSKVLFSL
jgi:hypothetical protein